MTATPNRTSLLSWLGMVGAVVVTIVVAVLIFRAAPTQPVRSASTARGEYDGTTQPPMGVQLVATAGPTTVHRRLTTAAFALSENQTLDARLPTGPFEAQITVTFHPGAVRRAAIGAEVLGGTLIIKRRGELLKSDYGGREGRTILADDQYLPARPVTFTFLFSRDATGPAQFRAVWQPEGSAVPLPLPVQTGGRFADKVAHGFALVEQFNCAACHVTDNARLQTQLAANPAPILGEIGARARPDWIHKWIVDPQAFKLAAAMPRLFHSDDLDTQAVEDLTHFLVSMGGPIDESDRERNDDLLNTGMVLYHTVGCFACHGALEPIERLPGGRPAGPTAGQVYTPLGPLALKTTVHQLAAFLSDPVSVRPSGRMPSLNLSELEAISIASYLISRDDGVSPRPSTGFTLDADRVERGRMVFASSGCANCHTLGPNRPTVVSTLSSPSLEQIAESTHAAQPIGGCLAEAPLAGVPDFAITPSQNEAMVAFLRTLADRRSYDVPNDELASTMDRLNCLACHSFNGLGGPEPAIARYFTTRGDADVGDEGRLPPNLDDIGARLNPHWLRAVLTDAGTARPYMGVRMPQFGEANVDRLPQLLASASGVAALPEHGPSLPSEFAAAGRQLTGARGFNCIQCHAIAGRDATDTPGPDLASMPERLRYAYFARWLNDPKLLRPGTRMPTFFGGGRSGIIEHFDGDADRQIKAMWAYLSQGEFLPLPEGLPNSGSFMLEVADTPVVLRTFMKDVGVRAIAIGFPEQVHCAFDADRGKLMMIWEGQFLSAQGAWGGRGGTETNPQQGRAWSASAGPVFLVADAAPSPWPETIETGAVRFRGYSLDHDGYPTIHYDLVGNENEIVSVSQQPHPVRRDGVVSFIRRFELRGSPGRRIVANLAGMRIIERSAGCRELNNGIVEITLDETGTASLSVEVTW